MKPTSFNEQSVVIAENQPEYLPTPAHIDKDGLVTMLWQLTMWERLTLLFTGKLWHQVMTFGFTSHPQMLYTKKPLINLLPWKAKEEGME